MSKELKPVRCGCGGEAEIIKHEFHGASPSYGVECTNCHAESWQFYNTETEAVEAWNLAMGVVAKNATTERSVQDCAENARCNERTAKVSKGAYDLMRCECGMPVSSNFSYCPRCRARLEWK